MLTKVSDVKNIVKDGIASPETVFAKITNSFLKNYLKRKGAL